jgi:hypothetical protein
MKVTRDEREALVKRMCNVHYNSARVPSQVIVKYYFKQKISRRTAYYRLEKYQTYRMNMIRSVDN